MVWPLYSNYVSSSKVTLSLPGKPSEISKSVGGTSPALIMVPNVDFLTAFTQGNLGIADKMTKDALYKNLNSPIASNNEMVARSFSESNGLGLEGNMEKYKGTDGKIKIPKSDIVLPESESIGFKAMEKAILQSIFETQKPYIEISKMVIDSIVSIEDIIARVMPLFAPGLAVLTATSLKPVGNAGSGSRPAAIGYQGGPAIKKAASDLDKISKIGGKLTVNKDGTITKESVDKAATEEGASDFSISQNEKLKELGKEWKVIDVVYSNGIYDPKIDYLYTYIDLPADDSAGGKKADTEEDEEDPYDKYKPKRIILGIFDSKGVPMNPNSKIKTIGPSGAVDTDFKRAGWILDSPKWIFPKSSMPDAVVWPSVGAPIYTWDILLGLSQENSKTQPLGGTLKRYKEGDKNRITGRDAIPGDPVISGFDSTDIGEYTKYFSEYTSVNMNMSKDLTDAEKKEYSDSIAKQLDIPSHLENVTLYGQGKHTLYKDFKVPEGMKLSFKPMQITVPEAMNDPKLAAVGGKIWIDPESDYETKIIQVKVATKIKYTEAKGEPTVQADIKSFVKNKAIFKSSSNRKFNIDIRKNGTPYESQSGVEQYTLENWNYDTDSKKISSDNYSIDIWSKSPDGKLAEMFAASNRIVMGKGTAYQKHGIYDIVITNNNGVYSYSDNDKSKSGDGIKKIGDGTLVEVKNKTITKWYLVYGKTYGKGSLPEFGQEHTISFNMKSLSKANTKAPGISSYYEPSSSVSTNIIPLCQIKVSNGSFPYGKIIDPTKIANEHLVKDVLYSDGRYGVGSKESPQELGTVYRYPLTDLDEETYYIIEGIRIDENDKAVDDAAGSGAASGAASGGGGGGSYRFPHAIGAMAVFAKFLVKIFSKLIPAITKLLKLFGSPMSFVSDIIMEKLGDVFSIFSGEAKKKFEKGEKIKKEKSKFNKPRPSTDQAPSKNMGDYVRRMKENFENSPLKNHVVVDSTGSFKDASGKTPKVSPKDAIGDFKFVGEGVGFIPFSIFGKDLSFGMELKMSNINTKEWGNSSPMRLVFDKEKNSKDDMLKATGPAKDDGNNENSKAAAKAEANLDGGQTLRQGAYGSLDPNRRYATISTWYSTGQFVNGVDYRYIYIDQQDEDLLKEIDRLSSSMDPEDLQSAKSKLEQALDKKPDDEALKNKLEDINKKSADLNSNTQPLLKMILGIVTLPIKIIAGVIQWIMDFFKSLTNPMALPGKMIEFLSFKWIMDFFSPLGILKMAGVTKMDPSKAAEWASKAKAPNSNKNLSDEEMLEKSKGMAKNSKGESIEKKADTVVDKKPDAAKEKSSPLDLKAKAAESETKLKKDVPLHRGSYAIPDDFAMADLSEAFSVAFLAQLPTYTARDMREQGTSITKGLFSPITCFIEKLINGIIDFVWSTLGIECVIAPPHIKICSADDPDTMDPNELGKILNGESTGASASGYKTEVLSTDPESTQTPPLERYVYEITLGDGRVVRAQDKEELDRFVRENSELGFDFQF
jgi:hypothetical protein